MRSTAWLVLPLLVIAPIYACAQGTPAETGNPGAMADAALGGAAGEQGGGAGQAGGAGTQNAGGSANQGGNAGSAGVAGTMTGGAAGGVAGGGAGGAAGGTAGAGTGGGGTGGNNCTPPVPGAPCDTFPQCGCKVGESCDVNDGLTGMTQCAPSSNTAKGAICEAINACAPGLSCVGEACKPFCVTATDCATTGADCVGVTYGLSDGGTGDVPGMKVCTDQCDPITAQGCGSGVACDPIDDINVTPGHSLCSKAGTSTTSCSNTVGCAVGYVCLSDNVCYKWCRSGVTSDCTSAQTCYQFKSSGTPSVVGYYYVGTQGFGVCGT
jgi:hypothetical protein